MKPHVSIITLGVRDLNRAKKPAQRAPWGGYFGYFTDRDGYLWKVASGEGQQPFAAE